MRSGSATPGRPEDANLKRSRPCPRRKIAPCTETKRAAYSRFMRPPLALLALLGLAACGVPEAKYAAAVKDADDARAAQKHDAEEHKKRLADLESELQRAKDSLSGAETRASTSEQERDKDRAQLEELRRAKAQADATARLFRDFVAKFKKLSDAGKLKIVLRHGRLVLQLANDILFDPYKTDIKPAGKQALIEVAQTLKTVQGRRFQVAGHTDVAPVNKDWPSNWELSTARATAVVKLLTASGVNPAVLSAAGYAMFDPLGRDPAKNRRTEITLVPNLEELIAIPLPEVPKGE